MAAMAISLAGIAAGLSYITVFAIPSLDFLRHNELPLRLAAATFAPLWQVIGITFLHMRLRISPRINRVLLPAWTALISIPTWLAIEFAFQPNLVRNLLGCIAVGALSPWEPMARFLLWQNFITVPALSLICCAASPSDDNNPACHRIRILGTSSGWLAVIALVLWILPSHQALPPTPAAIGSLAIAWWFVLGGSFLVTWMSWLGWMLAESVEAEVNEIPLDDEVWQRFRRCLWIVLSLLLVFLAYGSLFPSQLKAVPLSLAWSDFVARILQVTPWRQSDAVTNMLMFVPVGFIAMGSLSEVRETIGHNLLKSSVVLLGGLMVSALLEFSQVFALGRTVSLQDVIAQTIGNACGIGIWLFAGPGICTSCISRLRNVHRQGSQVLSVLLVYTVILVAYQLWPFHLTITVGQLSRKYRHGFISLILFADLATTNLFSLLMAIVLYAPAGFLLAAHFTAKKDARWKYLAIGVTLVSLVEFGQIFIKGRYATTTDVVLGTAGIILGASLFRLFTRLLGR